MKNGGILCILKLYELGIIQVRAIEARNHELLSKREDRFVSSNRASLSKDIIERIGGSGRGASALLIICNRKDWPIRKASSQASS
jgi:hypothetical protein